MGNWGFNSSSPLGRTSSRGSRGPHQERILIVGANSLCRRFAFEVGDRPSNTILILGFVADRAGEDTDRFGLLCLGGLDKLGDIIRRERPDRVLLAAPEGTSGGSLPELLAARLDGVVVEPLHAAYERMTGKLAIEHLRSSYLFSSGACSERRIRLILRRSLSLSVSLIGLVLAAPLMLLIALIIRVTAGKPIFFIQRRIGRHEKPFNLIKFRTMAVDLASPTSDWAADNGHRITRFGRWLRRFHLDELPQLLNVLRGEMNLIGPRPHPVSHYKLLTDGVPYYRLRSLIHPGITGWAQVQQGYADDLDGEIEKMRFDLYYIARPSLRLDLRILISTVFVIFRDEEAVAGRRPSMHVPDGAGTTALRVDGTS